MTVIELIQELQKLDHSSEVLVSGYEGGHTIVTSVIGGVLFKYDPGPYCGDYEEIAQDDKSKPDLEGVIIQ